MMRTTALVIVAGLALAVTPTLPATAMTTRAVAGPADGWKPSDPPADLPLFRALTSAALYSVTCAGVSATAWSADATNSDDDWDTVLMSTSQLVLACREMPGAPVVRQGSVTFTGRSFNDDTTAGIGTLQLTGDEPAREWTSVPTPRLGQWVGIAARSQTGAVLPFLTRRINSVSDDTFAVNAPIPATYVGAPVFDNMGRALGMLTAAGTVITGGPQFCAKLFDCTDPGRVWWNITAPSAVRALKATPGAGSVTVTWRPVASTGGDENIDYWYRVGFGPWKNGNSMRATIKAKRGTLVSVTVQAINRAGPGPETTVRAVAR